MMIFIGTKKLYPLKR